MHGRHAAMLAGGASAHSIKTACAARCSSRQSGCMLNRFSDVLPCVEGGMLVHGKRAGPMVSHPIYRFANRIANEDHGRASQTFLRGVESQVVQRSKPASLGC